MSEVLPGSETETKKRGRKPGSKNSSKTVSEIEIVSLAKGFQLLYEVPAFLQYGDHWRIGETDAENAARAFYEAAGSVESKLFQQIMKYARELMPWFAFMFIMYSITKPRIDKTLVLLNDRTRKPQTRTNQENSGRDTESPANVAARSDVFADETRFDEKSPLIS